MEPKKESREIKQRVKRNGMFRVVWCSGKESADRKSSVRGSVLRITFSRKDPCRITRSLTSDSSSLLLPVASPLHRHDPEDMNHYGDVIYPLVWDARLIIFSFHSVSSFLPSHTSHTEKRREKSQRKTHRFGFPFRLLHFFQQRDFIPIPLSLIQNFERRREEEGETTKVTDISILAQRRKGGKSDL